jgi:hypothetical protein
MIRREDNEEFESKEGKANFLTGVSAHILGQTSKGVGSTSTVTVARKPLGSYTIAIKLPMRGDAAL